VFRSRLFPDISHIFPSDSLRSRKSGVCGILIVVSSKFRACKRRYDLQLYDECVRVEIPTQKGGSLLADNHYFSRDTKSDIILQHFSSLEKKSR
jgi:hypothetical protein